MTSHLLQIWHRNKESISDINEISAVRFVHSEQFIFNEDQVILDFEVTFGHFVIIEREFKYGSFEAFFFIPFFFLASNKEYFITIICPNDTSPIEFKINSFITSVHNNAFPSG